MLSRAQGGDEDAFARLWRDLNPTLLRYLRVLTDSPDDVASDTWVAVVGGLPRFVGDEVAWRSWVVVTARRRAVDAGRRRTRRAALEEQWCRGARPAVSPDAVEAVIARQDTRAALDLVATLAPLQAEVVLLRVLVGLPVAEVAEVLGRTPGAVRVAAHRGLHHLEETLLGRGVTDPAPATLSR